MKVIYREMLTAILAFLWLFIYIGITMGEENIVEIGNAIVIQEQDSDNFHILMRGDMHLPDTTIVIDWATVDFWVSPNTLDTTFISIRLYPIAVDWDAENVSWDYPWSEPGGDFDKVHYGEFLVTLPGEQRIRLDITDLYMRWADGRLPYYGFLIGVSRSSLHGFSLIRNGTDPIATLTVQYAHTLTE